MSDSSICIFSKIKDCGGGRTGILGGRKGMLRGRTGILRGRTGILRGRTGIFGGRTGIIADGERRTAIDDFEECLNKT